MSDKSAELQTTSTRETTTTSKLKLDNNHNRNNLPALPLCKSLPERVGLHHLLDELPPDSPVGDDPVPFLADEFRCAQGLRVQVGEDLLGKMVQAAGCTTSESIEWLIVMVDNKLIDNHWLYWLIGQLVILIDCNGWQQAVWQSTDCFDW